MQEVEHLLAIELLGLRIGENLTHRRVDLVADDVARELIGGEAQPQEVVLALEHLLTHETLPHLVAHLLRHGLGVGPLTRVGLHDVDLIIEHLLEVLVAQRRAVYTPHIRTIGAEHRTPLAEIAQDKCQQGQADHGGDQHARPIPQSL